MALENLFFLTGGGYLYVGLILVHMPVGESCHQSQPEQQL